MLKTKLMMFTSLAMIALSTSGALAADYILLDVNGEKVKYSEVEQVWKSLFPSDEAPPLDGVEDAVRQNVLRGVVGEYLLFDNAMQSGIEKKPEIAKKIEGARKKVIIDAFLAEKASADVNEANIAAEYDKQKAKASGEEELKASHILLNSREKADEVAAKLKAKGDFATLAKEYSSDKGTSVAGGDLGYFTRETMVKEFADAAFALKLGEISAPVKTDFGWHIIKLVERRAQKFQSLEQARPDIEKKLRTRALHSYIDGLIDSADVEYFDKSGKQLEFGKVMKAK